MEGSTTIMSPPKFLEMLMGFKDRIDNGDVPKSNFSNLKPLLDLEYFTPRSCCKSNAAAGLTDFVTNNIYWDINENVEPMRLAAMNATAELDTAVAAKRCARQEGGGRVYGSCPRRSTRSCGQEGGHHRQAERWSEARPAQRLIKRLA